MLKRRFLRLFGISSVLLATVLVGQIASAAQTFTTYQSSNQATKKTRDVTGQGTAEATASSNTTGSFSVSSSSSSNTEAGAAIDPKAIYVAPQVPALYPCDPLYYAGVACPPPTGVGYNLAIGSASITQNATVGAAGTYTVEALLSGIAATVNRVYAGPPLYVSYANAAAQAQMYLTFYPCATSCYANAYRYKSASLVGNCYTGCSVSNGSQALSDQIVASGPGRIEIVFIVRAESLSQGRATSSATASAQLSSLSVTP